MVTVSVLVLTLVATNPPDKSPEPVQSLAEYARRLSDPDRDKRFLAALAIKKHYKGQSAEALPQILEALGEELDRPWHRGGNPSRADQFLKSTLSDIVTDSGTERIQVGRECVRSDKPQVRAAAFWAWSGAVNGTTSVRAEQDELLAACRRGLKDDSPLVRKQAVEALLSFAYAPPPVVEQVVPLLVTSLDDRVKVRGGNGLSSPASSAAVVLERFREKAKLAVGALIKATEADDPYLASLACRALSQIAQRDRSLAEHVVAALRSVFTDGMRSPIARENSIRSLIGLGPATSRVIQDLVELLDAPRTPAELRLITITAVSDMGQRATPAVPALVRRLDQTADKTEQHILFHAFEALGPAAAEAAGPIAKWMANSRDPDLIREAGAALVAIRTGKK